MRFARFAVLTLFVLCTACGGGGGGGDATAGPPVSPPTVGPATSGLLPAAPTPGAIVVDDPARLEPVRDGSSRQFKGTYVSSPGAAPVLYDNRWTQQVRTDGTVLESESNSFNDGPVSDEYPLVSEQLAKSFTINISGRLPETIQSPVLRAPLRAGDQYTLLDKRYTDTDIDQDLDGRTDILDAAWYTRVVGLDDVDLPGLGRVRAVRVETVLLLRVLFSSNGSFSPVFRTATMYWAVADIGIVRQRLESTRPSRPGEETYDELLVAWDGVTTGLGRMPIETPAPGLLVGAPDFPATPKAYVFADHVLLFGRTNDGRGDRISTFAVAYNYRGKALVSTLAQWDEFEHQVMQAVQVRDGMVVLATSSSGDTALVKLGMTDRRGARQGGATMTTVDLKGARSVALTTSDPTLVGDDTRVWLAWGRTYRDPSDLAFSIRYELVAQPFSPQGSPLGPEVSLQVPSPLTWISAAARGGRLLLAWLDPRSGDRLETASVSFGQTTFARPVLFADPLPSQPYLIQAVQFDRGGALLWRNNPVQSSPATFSGLQLDENLEAVQIGAGPQAATIPSVPTESLSSRQRAIFDGASANRLVLTGADTLPGAAPSTLRIVWIETAVDRAFGQAPLRSVSVQMADFEPWAMATLQDRVIFFSNYSTSIVWLRTAGP
jgi:hypothetical protein